MNANDVLKLIDAGFTREEILNLESTSVPTNPTPAPTEKAEPEIIPEPQAQPIPAPSPAEVVAAPTMVSDAQIEKLAQLINVGKSQIDIPPTKSLDDILAQHFTDLMVGK